MSHYVHAELCMRLLKLFSLLEVTSTFLPRDALGYIKSGICASAILFVCSSACLSESWRGWLYNLNEACNSRLQ